MIQDTQPQLDAAIAAGAITSPWWLQLFEQASHVYFIIGGAVLLTIRLALAIREWRKR
jgi:hypothetical protein